MERSRGAGFESILVENSTWEVQFALLNLWYCSIARHLPSSWTDRCGLAQVFGLLRHNADGGGGTGVQGLAVNGVRLACDKELVKHFG